MLLDCLADGVSTQAENRTGITGGGCWCGRYGVVWGEGAMWRLGDGVVRVYGGFEGAKGVYLV